MPFTQEDVENYKQTLLKRPGVTQVIAAGVTTMYGLSSDQLQLLSRMEREAAATAAAATGGSTSRYVASSKGV